MKKINLFLYFACTFIFIFTIITWNIQNPFRSDIKYFIDFVNNFPEFYSIDTFGFIGTVYFPYFSIFFYIFWLFGDHPTYVIFTIINFICILASIKISEDTPSSFKWTVRVILLLMVYPLAKWANVEMMITFIFILFSKEAYIKKQLSLFKIFILAFFSFKIVTILFIIPIVYFVNKPIRIKLLAFYFVSIILLNVPFIILNPQLLQIDYLLWIIENSPPSIASFTSPLGRTSFSIPFVWIIIKLIQRIGNLQKKTPLEIPTLVGSQINTMKK